MSKKDFNTKEHQVHVWYGGISIHSEKFGCCPDYSCCVKHLKANQAVKDRFMKAYIEKDLLNLGAILMFFKSIALDLNIPQTMH